jgi:anhydro-N-acetylmuramic acid kinase
MSDSLLRRLIDKDRRLMAGVMSGTSVDAVDVAFAYVEGSGPSLRVEPVGAGTAPIPDALRRIVEDNMVIETSSVRDLTLLNVRLAHLYADAVREASERSGVAISDIDAIGLHGQTLWHQPDPTELAGMEVAATLQIGDPSVLANLVGLPVVGNFRAADMALGGQGAPLVPYFDWAVFRSGSEDRILLNLGGIANVTALTAGGRLEDVLAFDTGPANTVLDALARRFLDARFDVDGTAARRGTASDALLDEMLGHPWFASSPPKSTGRELFSERYVDAFIDKARGFGLGQEDLFTTAAELTIRSVGRAYESFVAPSVRPSCVIVSGGGVHNPVLMEGLSRVFAGIPVESSAEHGIDPDAKEALCFATLAHETLSGAPSNVPSATGAADRAILGTICIPGASGA